MHTDRASTTALVVAMIVVLQGGGGNDVWEAQVALLTAAGLLRTTFWVNSFTTQTVRMVGNLFVDGFMDGIIYRKHWIEERTRRILSDSECQQVLVIAAGYDTLAHRLSSEITNVSFWEVDHPATGSVKQRALQKMGTTVHCVAADLTEKSLSEALSTTNYNATHPTIVIMEGLTFYMTRDAVLELLSQVHSVTGPRSYLLLDHFTARDIQEQFGFRLTAYVKEPMQFGIDAEELTDFVSDGWRVLEQGASGPERLALLQRIDETSEVCEVEEVKVEQEEN